MVSLCGVPGSGGEADVAQMEATYATDDYEVTLQQSLYDKALLTLKQLMNYPIEKPLELAPEEEMLAEITPCLPEESEAIYALAKLDNPDNGNYYLAGEEVSHLKEKKRTKYRKGRIGFVFQSFNLIDELTVEENIELQLKYLNVPKAERKERVLEILRKVSLSQRATHYPQQLSGGQQQRVAIARATVGKPKLILADEPTGNLDSKNGLEVMQLLSQLNAEGTTIVMVTHSQHDATYANRIINLFDGEVVENTIL